MNVFLEIATRLGGADGGEIVHRGFEKFGNIVFDLLAQAGVLESLAQICLFNVCESATQRTFHNVVVHHCSARESGNVAGVPHGIVPAAREQ
jgi:hypothetical protein